MANNNPPKCVRCGHVVEPCLLLSELWEKAMPYFEAQPIPDIEGHTADYCIRCIDEIMRENGIQVLWVGRELTQEEKERGRGITTWE